MTHPQHVITRVDILRRVPLIVAALGAQLWPLLLGFDWTDEGRNGSKLSVSVEQPPQVDRSLIYFVKIVMQTEPWLRHYRSYGLGKGHTSAQSRPEANPGNDAASTDNSCATTWQGENISPGTHTISAIAVEVRGYSAAASIIQMKIRVRIGEPGLEFESRRRRSTARPSSPIFYGSRGSQGACADDFGEGGDFGAAW